MTTATEASGFPDTAVREGMTEAYEALRDALSAQEPARALECLTEARRMLDGATILLVAELRRRRWSWQDIAGVLDVSRQSAHERYARAVRQLEQAAAKDASPAVAAAAPADVGEVLEDHDAGDLAAGAAAPADVDQGAGEASTSNTVTPPAAVPEASQGATTYEQLFAGMRAEAVEQVVASPQRPPRRRRREVPAATPAPAGNDAAAANPWDPYEMVAGSQGSYLITYKGKPVASIRPQWSPSGRTKRWMPCTPSGARIGTRAYGKRLDAVARAVGDHHAKHVEPKSKRQRRRTR